MNGDGYHTGLCDCFDDCGVCISVCCCSWTFCPSAFNWADSRLEECDPCHWCAMAHPLWTRGNIRKINNGALGGHCGDWCVYLCCFQLATCQDSRELKIIRQNEHRPYINNGLNSEASLASISMVAPSAEAKMTYGYGVPSYTQGNGTEIQAPVQPYVETTQ